MRFYTINLFAYVNELANAIDNTANSIKKPMPMKIK